MWALTCPAGQGSLFFCARYSEEQCFPVEIRNNRGVTQSPDILTDSFSLKSCGISVPPFSWDPSPYCTQLYIVIQSEPSPPLCCNSLSRTNTVYLPHFITLKPVQFLRARKHDLPTTAVQKEFLQGRGG